MSSCFRKAARAPGDVSKSLAFTPSGMVTRIGSGRLRGPYSRSRCSRTPAICASTLARTADDVQIRASWSCRGARSRSPSMRITAAVAVVWVIPQIA